MSEIDILVHPADSESFGRMAVEAMAAGLPVVGVRGGGIAEIVADGEPACSPLPTIRPTWPKKLRQLLDSPELRAHNSAPPGRARAEAHYSIEA